MCTILSVKTDKASEDYCCAPKEDCDADCENPDGCSQTSSQHPYECHEPTTTVTTATATSTTTTCGNRNQYYPYECLDTTTTIAPVTNRHCGHSFGCGPESDDDADNDIYDQSKQFGNWARVVGAVVGGLFCLGIFGFVCCAAATGKLGNNANQRQAPTFGADNTAAGSPYGI